MNKTIRWGSLAMSAALLIGCKGIDINVDEGTPPDTAPSAPFELSLELKQAKKFAFSWPAVADADHYRLYENVDGASGFTQIGADIPAGTETITIEVPLFERLNAQYMVEHCDTSGCESSDVVSPTRDMIGAIGYFKPGKFGRGFFGASVDLSHDGSVMVIGQPEDDSVAQGVNGDESDMSGDRVGSAHVFVKDGGVWSKEAYLKQSNPDDRDYFGEVVAIDDAGDTILVTAYNESSLTTDPLDNSGWGVGAAYIFEKNAGAWTQIAYLKASNADNSDMFGVSADLSGDGLTAAIGATPEASNAQGINGNEADNTAGYSGAVYVFKNNAGTWAQEAYIKASNAEANDEFGRSVALSYDGNTLLATASIESSNAVGVNGNQGDNTASSAGAAYIFNRSGTTWTQTDYLKASNTDANDEFGNFGAISDDGLTVVIGAHDEDSSSTGVNGSGADNSATNVGSAYVFQNNAGTWSEQAYLKPGVARDFDGWGWRVAISGDGDQVVMSATLTDSNDAGLGGNESDTRNEDTGSFLVFKRDAGIWSPEAHAKAINPGKSAKFGHSLAISGDGSTIASGSMFEFSGSTGINGSTATNGFLWSDNSGGAVYLY